MNVLDTRMVRPAPFNCLFTVGPNCDQVVWALLAGHPPIIGATD